jgi:hypothetical protein
MVRMMWLALLLAWPAAQEARAQYRGFGPGFTGVAQSFALGRLHGVRASYGTYRVDDAYGPVYGYEGYYPRVRKARSPFGGFYPRYRGFHRAGYTF